MAQGRGSYRFVHTADLHLDSPLSSAAARDARLAAAIAGATRDALEAIVTLCIDEQVDALAIAGDLYDGRNSSIHTAAALSRALRRLDAVGIPVFIVLGNHDAQSKLTAGLELPANTQLFGGRVNNQLTPCTRACFHGVSYAKPTMSESLLGRYAPPVDGVWNIGLMHTSLTGESGHHTYAPCKLDDLVAHGFDYWGLGHIHKREVHRASGPAVVMPGIPQGRHINEAGAKSVTLVTLAETGVTLEERSVASVRFDRLSVDVDGIDSLPALSDAIERQVDAAHRNAGELRLALRIELTGESTMADRLRSELGFLETELRQSVADRDGVLIDSVRSSVNLPGASQISQHDGLVDDLTALLDDDLLDSPAQRERREAVHKQLIRKLPRELNRLFGIDDTERLATLDRLAREGSDALLGQLRRAD